ncbi:alkaline phosphatase [Danxiaibacter flavus]|uniref:Alkaline phosphatase n=1 Tax=Danxiaibacter flavus TaxID=3049108 RepID=A0ABV3ZCL7_9BACT|nr:alkaline phosphatase [Chitinophagaceae bacterium DXS]
MKKIILSLCSLFCLHFCFAQIKNVKHVVLIGFDGFGAYSFDKADIPNIRNVMNSGSWSLHARSVLPSSSADNWASMLMGAGTELHGYTEWDSKKPELPSQQLDQFNMFPSIFTLLKEQKPAAETGVVYEWGGIGYLFPHNAVSFSLHAEGDSNTLVKSIDYIKSKKPLFTFVHFSDIDGVGHNIGHGTPEYYQQVHKSDKYVGEIMQALDDAGMKENTIVIISADHGGINKGHGGKTLQEVEIPWIIAGPGVKSNNEVKESIMTYDTAATIAYILGLKTPQVWTGRNVAAAFKK